MALVQAQEWDKSTYSVGFVGGPELYICRVTWLKTLMMRDVILWKIVTSDVKVE